MRRTDQNEEIAELIESQLYSTYLAIANEMDLPNGEIQENVNWVLENDLPWPCTIFGQADSHSIEQARNQIVEGKLPINWILRRNASPGELDLAFEKCGFRKLMIWPGMALDLTTATISPTDDIVRKIEREELKNWAAIVNNILFKKNPVPISFFERIYESKLNLNFYGSFVEGQMVSTALTFGNKDYQTIYMVATIPEFRKQGYSSALINLIIREAKNSNRKALFLQATPKSATLYSNLGFQTFCHFDIYCFLQPL